MTRHTFTRRDGSSFTLDMTVDHDKLAREMAIALNKGGKVKKRATRCAGSIIATLVNDNREPS